MASEKEKVRCTSKNPELNRRFALPNHFSDDFEPLTRRRIWIRVLEKEESRMRVWTWKNWKGVLNKEREGPSLKGSFENEHRTCSTLNGGLPSTQIWYKQYEDEYPEKEASSGGRMFLKESIFLWKIESYEKNPLFRKINFREESTISALVKVLMNRPFACLHWLLSVDGDPS